MTPQMHGRYPDYDVLAEADALGRGRRGRSCSQRVERRARRPLLHARRSGHADGVLRRRARPGLRAADPRARAGGRQAARRASSTATATPDMPDDGETWRLVARGLDERRAAARRAGFAARRREVEHGDRRRASPTASSHGGAWDELTCAQRLGVVMRERWARSTRIRGPGTRSASAARPTRAATRGWASACARPGRERRGDRARSGPGRRESVEGRRVGPHCVPLQGRSASGGQRLRASCSTCTAASVPA